jgi:hypothetical protein
MDLLICGYLFDSAPQMLMLFKLHLLVIPHIIISILFDTKMFLYTFRSHYRRTSSGPLPEVNNNDPNCQSNHRNPEENGFRKASLDLGTSSSSSSTLNRHRESFLGAASYDFRTVTSSTSSSMSTTSRRSRDETMNNGGDAAASSNYSKPEDRYQVKKF